MKENSEDFHDSGSVDQDVELMKRLTLKKAQEILGKTNRRKYNEEWVTDEILNLFEERRMAATKKNRTQYQQIQQKLRRKIREAKANLMKEKRERIEQLQKLHDEYHIHKELQMMAGLYKPRKLMMLYNTDRKPIIEEKEIRTVWETYVTELFHADCPKMEEEIIVEDHLEKK
jgi:hypothetical protein